MKGARYYGSPFIGYEKGYCWWSKGLYWLIMKAVEVITSGLSLRTQGVALIMKRCVHWSRRFDWLWRGLQEGFFNDLLTDWFIDWLIVWLIGGLIDWLVDWWIYWFIDWLINCESLFRNWSSLIMRGYPYLIEYGHCLWTWFIWSGRRISLTM